MNTGFSMRLQSAGKWVVLLIAGVMFAGLFGLSVATRATMDLDEHTYYLMDGVLYRVGSVVACAALVWLFRRHRIRWAPGKRTRIALTILFGLIMVTYVSLLSLAPRADQSHVLRCATWLTEGNYAQWDEGGYLYVYPHQNALTLAFYAMVQVFGKNSYLAIQYINIPLFILSAYCVADTARMIFNSRALGAWAYAALLLFFPLAMYVTFIYGTLIGLALSLCGLWLIVRALRGGKIATGIVGAAFIAFSAIMRISFIISIIAFSIALLFYALRMRTAKPLAFLAVVIVCLIGGRMLVTVTVEHMTGRVVNEGNPSATWIAMGLQKSKRAAGWYNRYNLNTYIESNYDEEVAHATAVASIRQSIRGFLRDKSGAVSFFAQKIASQWNNGTFQGIWVSQNRASANQVSPWVRSLFNETGVLNNGLTRAGDMLLPVIWLGALLFLAFGFRKLDVFSLVFVIAFIGGFFFSLIWEAKCQYTIAYVFMLIPCALRGYQLAVTRPVRESIPFGVPMVALACGLIAVAALVFPTGKSAKQYAACLWRAAGGDAPEGMYELVRTDGSRLLMDGTSLVLSEEGGTRFTLEGGILLTETGKMALDVQNGSKHLAGSTVGIERAMSSMIAQRWYAEEVEGGGYYIRFGKSLALTCGAEGGFAVQELTGGDDQTWYFVQTEE